MLNIDIGAGSSANDVPITPLYVPAGQTITVANLAASLGTVSYYSNLESAAAGTIASEVG